MDCVRRRGKVYCAIVTVPADLRLLLGKRQIWRSLKTKNYSVARSEARKVLMVADQLFSQIRNTMDSRLINGMVAEYGLKAIADMDKARIGVKVSDNEEYNEFMLHRAECIRALSSKDPETTSRTLAGIAAMYQREDAAGKYLYVSDLADSYLTLYNKRGLVGEPGEVTEDDFKEVAAAFATVERHLFKVESERILGITEDDSDYQHRLLGRWKADLTNLKDVGIQLSDLFSAYLEEWSKGHETARANRKRKELERLERSFVECFGRVPRVKEITEEMAKEWREYLQYEFYDEELTNKSVNNYLETLSAVFNYGHKHKSKYTDGNPFKGLNLPKGEASEKSRIFESKELQEYVKLLGDLYTPDRPELTWIPLIMMLSGMRCNEVAQLYIDDIQERDGIHFFRVADNKDRNQRVKTDTSKREVPIHNKLIELGFLRHVARMADAEHVQVFPNCRYREGVGLYYDANMSNLLNTPINLIDSDKKLRLYSLRANFRNSIEEKFIDSAIAALDGGSSSGVDAYSKYTDLALNNIMGHKVKGTMGDTVYRKKQLHISNIVLQQAEYPIDFSPLMII